ncbi:HDOD domain-containing protein [Pseudodesulfovibrio sp.]|uniref:HDOD domain-containing protein n=1 Tax=unclassified Pseudodesulfovibrio TaxID=2661612 RepID=UPI003AFF92ED
MKVWVNDLKPGMVLDADVKGTDGRLLLPAGTEVGENHLRVLNIWGVSEADIRPDSIGEASVPAPNLLARAEAHAESLFAHADLSIVPMEQLKRACILYYVNMLAAGDSLPSLPQPVLKSVELPAAPLFADAEAFLHNDTQLGVFPEIYRRIVEALNNPASSSSSLADIIAQDPGLSASLLKLVNSALYGYSQPVDSLSRAVALVGTQGLTQLALGVTVMNTFRNATDRQAMAAIRCHCVATAAICRILGVQVAGISQDLCFVSGLLHGVGRMIMLRKASEASETARRMSLANGIPLDAAQRRVFGFDEGNAARTLFRAWHFPEDIITASTGLNEPAVRDHTEAAICAMGSVLATAMHYGTGGNGMVHTIPEGAWDRLGLPESSLATTLAQAGRQVDDLLNVFLERI